MTNQSPSQDLVAGFGIAFFERRIITVLVVYALVYIVLYLVSSCAVNGVLLKNSIVTMLYTMPPFALVFAIAGIVFRRVALWRALRMVSADKARYDAMWDSVLSQDQSRTILANLQAEVRGRTEY